MEKWYFRRHKKEVPKSRTEKNTIMGINCIIRKTNGSINQLGFFDDYSDVLDVKERR